MRLTVDLTALGPATLAQRAAPGQWAAPGLNLEYTGEIGIAQDPQALVLVRGHPREGDTLLDAAALLRRHHERGTGLTRGLAGAYAIAIVDVQRHEVTLLNDRMAVYGWCYSHGGQRFDCSDRADTLGSQAEIEPQAVFTYLFNHVIPSPDTLFRGVRRLPPAYRLQCSSAGLTLSQHWRPEFAEPRKPHFDSLRDEFRSLLRSAVAREWQRLGPETGTFLSGGTDSSTVSGMLRDVAGQPVRAYSIGFDADGYDEMAYARIAAKHFGLEHREYYLTPEDVATGMPLVATHYDQPFGNSSAVAAFHCARVAREEGRSALLAGDGGDELFGGNARYAKQSIFGWYQNVPRVLRRKLMEPAFDNRVAARVPGLSKASSYVQQARVPMPDRLHMYNLLQRLGLDEVLAPGFVAQVSAEHDITGQRAVYRQSRGAQLVNRMLAYDWKYTLADNDLPKVVGTTGLAGIAAAFPLLSDEIIDFSLRLPAHYKLKGLKLRWFFKEALRGFLPDEILKKKKQGFGLPFGVWALRHPQLSALADDALGSFGTRGVVAPGFMRRLREELLPSHPGYYGELVWIIAMMEFWLREKRPDWKLA